MEHLLSPEGSATIEIPYLCEEEYDGGDFMDYPHRKKWSERDLKGYHDFGGRSPKDVEAFFQTWLFFGTLQSIFGPVGIEVTTDDLTRSDSEGNKLINTEKLPGFFQAWMNHEGMREDREKDNEKLAPNFQPNSIKKQDKDDRGATVEMILRRVHFFATRYCNTEGQEETIASKLKPSFWPMSPKVAMTILAIDRPLFSTATEVYGYARYAQPNWGSSPFLNDRLREAGWCIREIPTFTGPMAVDCDYYFGSVRSPCGDLDHSECTKIICKAKNVDVTAYVTKHVPGCNDEGVDYIQAPENMKEIVRAGGIPIMRWQDEKLICYEFKPGSKSRYVAISHVWADGMGNEEDNALPACQLDKIQAFVTDSYAKQHISTARRYHQAYSEGHSADGSLEWWDGDKWEDALPALPKEQVDVGFWMDTLCVPREAKLRRQAILKMRKIYEDAHRVLVLDATIMNVPLESDITTKYFRLYQSNYLRRLWTLHEAVLARSLFFQLKGGTQTAHELKDEARTYASIKHFYSSLVHKCATPFETLFEFYVFLGTKPDDITVNMAFSPFVDAICHRSTKQPEDETICFTALLRLDVDALLQAPSNQRMEKFYQLVGNIGSSIIYNTFPRLQTPGYRWAPRSFIGQGYSLAPISNKRAWEVQRPPAAIRPGGGLLFTSPGALLNPQMTARISGEDSISPVGKRPHDARYAVISFEDIQKKSPPSEAILAIVESTDDEDEGRITVEPISRAKLTVPDQAALKKRKSLAAQYLKGAKKFKDVEKTFKGVYPVLGERLKSKQKWCVM